MSWLSERARTLAEAAGHRRYLIGGIAATALAAIDAVSGYRVMSWLIGVPAWAVVLIVALAVMVLWLLEYATRLRLEREPHVTLHSPRIEKDEELSPCVVIAIENVGGVHLKECLVTLNKVTPMPPGWTFKDLPVSLPTVPQTAGNRRGSFQLRPSGSGESGQVKNVTVIRYGMDGWIEVNTEHGWKRISLSNCRAFDFEFVGQCEYGSRSKRVFRVQQDDKEGFSMKVLM